MNLEQFKNIDKYKVNNLSNAIDNAIDVSFAQMIDTVRTQCYMSQKQDSWEDCTELQFLEDIPMLFTDGRDIKESIKNQMKRVVISALTDSDWVGNNIYLLIMKIDYIKILMNINHNLRLRQKDLNVKMKKNMILVQMENLNHLILLAGNKF